MSIRFDMGWLGCILLAVLNPETHDGEAPKLTRPLLRKLELHREFPLSSLAAVAEARRVLDEIEFRAVLTARDLGATWEDIAQEMGLTRQAVFHRYHAESGGNGSSRDHAGR